MLSMAEFAASLARAMSSRSRMRSFRQADRRLTATVALLLVASAVLAVAAVSAVVPGTPGADVLRGTRGADVMSGRAGADRIFGYRGPDRIFGGAGADRLVGGAGRDRVEGGPGNDRILVRDGERDSVSCGRGTDIVERDRFDLVHRDCEIKRGWQPGGVPPVPPPPPPPPPPAPGKQVVLVDQPWVCKGRVDLDLVRVTMRSSGDDAIALDQDCNGRVGRVEVETWTADGIKIQNRGTVAHDLVIESGYVKCHAVQGGAHQDGVQAMGGHRITFRNLRVDCLRNSNFYLSRGGSGATTPTDIICDRCVFGPNSGQTLFYNRSVRSGARNSIICTGRYTAIRVNPGAEAPVNVGNTVLPRNHPTCANVTGRGGR
jgi:Ca2+-binding RTX toxin-like protein